MMNKTHQLMPLNLKSLKTKFTLRFLRALKHINHQEKTTHSNQRHHKVKLAAYSSMASAVGPNQAWARAMQLRIRRHHVGPARRHQRMGQAQWAGPAQEELRRLVPGGEDIMDMQSLVDETAHYIKCLTTQVEAMRCIVNCCSTSLTNSTLT